MEKTRIALVEIAGSHDECLYTQVLALFRKQVEITFVCSQDVYERCMHLHAYFHQVYFLETTGNALSDFQKMRQLIRYFKNQQIQKVVFNTAQGGHIRNLAILWPKHIEAYGIIHTVRKFQGSRTQKIINKAIKRYLILSDDLLQRIVIPKGVLVESFYPLDFPAFNTFVQKKENEIWLTITGGVEYRRKDLPSIFALMRESDSNVKFVFLGKTDISRLDVAAFVDQLAKEGFSDRVQLFYDFVPNDLFDAYVRKSDFLLPLIHPGTQSAEQYISNQISGAFSLSFGYKIPLLIHEAYATEADLRLAAAFYTVEAFKHHFNKALLERRNIQARIQETEKWLSAVQQDRYNRFIGV